MSVSPKFIIIGCGSIGSYLGGLLIHQGFDVILVGRKSLWDQIEEAKGLTLTSFDSKLVTVISTDRIKYRTTPGNLADRNMILFCGKLGGLQETAESLASSVKPTASIFSMQNGVVGAEILRKVFPENFVAACMIGFTVNWLPRAKFHLGASLPLVIQKDTSIARTGHDVLVKSLIQCGLNCYSTFDIESLQRAKLLINLNNPINALCGLSMHDMFQDPLIREVWAKLIEEGLAVFRAHSLDLAAIGRVNTKLAPYILRLPNFLYSIAESLQVKLDPKMISSMQSDVRQNKVTEIEFLCGEIVRLGSQKNISTPCNLKIRELIHKMETENVYRPYSSKEISYLLVGPTSTSRSGFRWLYNGVIQSACVFLLFIGLF